MSAGDPTSGEMCQRCDHDADDHEPDLGFCLHQGCNCLMYVSEADVAEDAEECEDAVDGLPEELDFDD